MAQSYYYTELVNPSTPAYFPFASESICDTTNWITTISTDGSCGTPFGIQQYCMYDAATNSISSDRSMFYEVNCNVRVQTECSPTNTHPDCATLSPVMNCVPITINCSCPADYQILSVPTAATGLQMTQVWNDCGEEPPQFFYWDFPRTHGCRLQYYPIIQPGSPNTWGSWNWGYFYGSTLVMRKLDYVVGTYEEIHFTMNGTMEDGFPHVWQIMDGGEAPFYLKLIIQPCDNVITELAYTNGLSFTQTVARNDPINTQFILPPYNNSCGGCATNFFTINMISSSANGLIAVNQSATFDNYTMPVDITLDWRYEFTITVTDGLGNTITSSLLTLNVGCTDACQMIFDYTDTDFSPMPFAVGDTVIDNIYIFTYTSHQMSDINAGCILGNVEIVTDSYTPITNNDGRSQPSLTFLPNTQSCQPSNCGSVSISSFDHLFTISFRMKLFYGGPTNPSSIFVLSEPILLVTQCVNNGNVVIEPSTMHPTVLNYPLYDQTLNNLTIVFRDFGCNYLSCCDFDVNSYEIIDNSTGLPISNTTLYCCYLESSNPNTYSFTVNNMNTLFKSTLYIKGTNKILGNTALSTEISFSIFDAGLPPPVPPEPNITNSEFIYQGLDWEQYGLQYDAASDNLVALEGEVVSGVTQDQHSSQQSGNSGTVSLESKGQVNGEGISSESDSSSSYGNHESDSFGGEVNGVGNEIDDINQENQIKQSNNPVDDNLDDLDDNFPWLASSQPQNQTDQNLSDFLQNIVSDEFLDKDHIKWLDREKFYIIFDSFNELGEVKFVFSEPLQSIDDYQFINLTTISTDRMFNVKFKTYMEDQRDKYLMLLGTQDNTTESKVPVLHNWFVKSFTNYELVLQLNFTNKMYVSSTTKLDLFKIEFLFPKFFRAKKDGMPLFDYVTILDTVPKQSSSVDEFTLIEQAGNTCQILMIISLIAPLLLKIFLSVGILFDLVFDMLNMLQVIVSVQYLMPMKFISQNYIGPSSVQQFLKLLDSIVYFKPFQNQIIKDFIQNHQGFIRKLESVVIELGAVIFIILFLIVLIIIIGVLSFLTKQSPGKVNDLVEKIKKQLMWTPIIRSVIQGYLGFALSGFLSTKTFVKQDSNEKVISVCLMIISVVVPVATFLFVHKKQDKFSDEDMQNKFGALYKSQRLDSQQEDNHLWYTPLFFTGRLLLVISIVFMTDFSLSQFWTYTFKTLALSAFILSQRPFSRRLLNRMCAFNSCLTLFGCSYYIILFSDLVPSMEARSIPGQYFIIGVLAAICLNFLVISQQIVMLTITKMSEMHEKRLEKKKRAQEKQAEKDKEEQAIEQQEVEGQEERKEEEEQNQDQEIDQVGERKAQMRQVVLGQKGIRESGVQRIKDTSQVQRPLSYELIQKNKQQAQQIIEKLGIILQRNVYQEMSRIELRQQESNLIQSQDVLNRQLQRNQRVRNYQKQNETRNNIIRMQQILAKNAMQKKEREKKRLKQSSTQLNIIKEETSISVLSVAEQIDKTDQSNYSQVSKGHRAPPDSQAQRHVNTTVKNKGSRNKQASKLK